MKIDYYAPFAEKTGFAQAAHDYMLALHRAGVELEIFPLKDVALDDLDERYDELIPLATEHKGKIASHRIAHAVPRAIPMLLPQEKRDFVRVGLTTWETTKAPEAIAKELKLSCDMLVVPSEFCCEAFMPNLCSKIEVVPHTFDPGHWPMPSIDDEPDDSPYIFYSVLGWCERKAPISLVKAYISEFSADEDVVLRLKLSDYNQDDMAALMYSSGLNPETLPAVEVVTDYLGHEEMVDFHVSGHVFVTAARGEGWNLPAFEAAIMGRHVIATGFGGETDYLNRYANGYTSGYQLTPVFIPPTVSPDTMDMGGVQVRAVQQVGPSGITCQSHWAEADLYSLQKTMRHCYQNRLMPNNSSRAALEDTYSLDRVGRQFASLLERISP